MLLNRVPPRASDGVISFHVCGDGEETQTARDDLRDAMETNDQMRRVNWRGSETGGDHRAVLNVRCKCHTDGPVVLLLLSCFARPVPPPRP